MSNEVEIVITSKDNSSAGFKAATSEAGKYGKSLEVVGEKADRSERNLIGVKDVIDGTATIMQGPGKAGLVAYIQGWADLAGGIVPLIEVMSKVTLATIASTAAKAKDLAVTIAHTVAQKAAAVASGLWTAAQWLLNVAMDANPIGAIILAIMALVGVIILIATKTTWFQSIWKAVWDFMKGVGAWFAGPFADSFVNAWNRIVGFFKGIGSAIADAFHGAINFVKSGINGVIDLVNKAVGFINNNLIGTLNKIPGVNIPLLGLAPHLATGGIASGLAVVGERGRELVDLGAGAHVYNNDQTEQMLAGGSAGKNITLTIDMTNAPAEIKAWLRKVVTVDGGGNVQLAFGS